MSDTSPKCFEAPARHRANHLTAEQRGLAVAALVAFLGIVYLGPALMRFRRAPTNTDKIKRRLRQTLRRQGQVGKRPPRLGFGIMRRRK